LRVFLFFGGKIIRSKIVIIGANNIGKNIAYAMEIRKTVDQITMIDLEMNHLDGDITDLKNGHWGTFSDCADANLIIIAIDNSPLESKSGEDLIVRNLTLLQSIIGEITKILRPNGTQPILLIISESVDIMTYFATKYSGFSPQKVIGLGTMLDNQRFRHLIGHYCGIDAHDVTGYVIGEQGSNEIIAWSQLRIGGITMNDYCRSCTRKCDKKIFEYIENEFVEKSQYGIGISVARITESILRNQNMIFPVSSIMFGINQVESVALSMPSIINADGIRQIIELNLGGRESEKLRKTSERLQTEILEIEKRETKEQQEVVISAHIES